MLQKTRSCNSQRSSNWQNRKCDLDNPISFILNDFQTWRRNQTKPCEDCLYVQPRTQPTTRGYIDSGTPWWSRCPREAGVGAGAGGRGGGGAPQGGEGQSRDPKMDMARQKNLRGEVLTKEAGFQRHNKVDSC